MFEISQSLFLNHNERQILTLNPGTQTIFIQNKSSHI
jgi:hypothetical protein